MSSVLLGLVGDCLVDRDDPPEAFSAVRSLLRETQLLFGNLEGAYSDRPNPPPGAPVPISPAVRNLDAYAQAGFGVFSLANNHIMDGGAEAMLDTRERLRAQGIATCGAGASLDDARQVARVERNGVRIAFLAYASMFPVGYEAGTDRPGLVPLRAYNFYRELSLGAYRPGALPIVQTVPDESDHAGLITDLERAREGSDLVIASFHWGDHRRPFHLTDHERRTARLCIDHGADLVVGHHHHALRGMEYYKGKPILYGLGHFVFDLRQDLSSLPPLQDHFDGRDLSYEVGPREGWPLLPLHEDTRMTAVAWAELSGNRVARVGYVPCKLTPDGVVHPLDPEGADGQRVVAYMERCNSNQSLSGVFVPCESSPFQSFSCLELLPPSSHGAVPAEVPAGS